MSAGANERLMSGFAAGDRSTANHWFILLTDGDHDLLPHATSYPTLAALERAQARHPGSRIRQYVTPGCGSALPGCSSSAWCSGWSPGSRSPPTGCSRSGPAGDRMPFDLETAFHAACPGIVATREIDAALHALPPAPSAAQIEEAVLPLAGGALPAQPTVLLAIDGNAARGTVATFAKGLPRFADSNPAPRDGWSIERGEAAV